MSRNSYSKLIFPLSLIQFYKHFKQGLPRLHLHTCSQFYHPSWVATVADVNTPRPTGFTDFKGKAMWYVQVSQRYFPGQPEL